MLIISRHHIHVRYAGRIRDKNNSKTIIGCGNNLQDTRQNSIRIITTKSTVRASHKRKTRIDISYHHLQWNKHGLLKRYFGFKRKISCPCPTCLDTNGRYKQVSKTTANPAATRQPQDLVQLYDCQSSWEYHNSDIKPQILICLNTFTSNPYARSHMGPRNNNPSVSGTTLGSHMTISSHHKEHWILRVDLQG